MCQEKVPVNYGQSIQKTQILSSYQIKKKKK